MLRVTAGAGERAPIVSASIFLGALTALVLAGFMGVSVGGVATFVSIAVIFAAGHSYLLKWRSLLTVLLLIILFIPIRRYVLPGGSAFQLEPYRLAVGLILLAWVSSLLVDPRVRFRRTGFEGPFVAYVAIVLFSLIFNPGNTSGIASDVTKSLTFFLSFVLVFFMFGSLVRTRSLIDQLLRVLVAGGAVIALLAVIESRTGYNPFNHLQGKVPGLRANFFLSTDARGGSARAQGPAEHPIALGALLVMLVPLSYYLGRATGGKRWWLATAALLLGSVATLSRTTVMMLTVVILVFLWLRTRETRRMWPLLIPAVVLVHFALPGHLGTLASSFFPKGGLIASQETSPGNRASAGRIADLPGAINTFKQSPIVGIGFGTRIVSGPKANAPILDDQWLDTLIETGIAGVGVWLWLFVRFVRKMGREAKEDPGERGLLLAAIAAATAAYAVGMLTFDAFSFVQVTLLLYILLALGSVVMGLRPDAAKPAVAG
jgi:polysaccharide biosynthesis protein PslJ